MNVPISTAPNSLSRGGSTRGTIGAVAEPLVAIVLSRRQEVKSGGREVLARKYARTGIISRGSSRHDQHNYRFFWQTSLLEYYLLEKKSPFHGRSLAVRLLSINSQRRQNQVLTAIMLAQRWMLSHAFPTERESNV